MAEVLSKNKFGVGDSIELMTPSGNHRYRLDLMENLEGKSIDEAPGGGHRVRIPVPVTELEMGLISRYL
jgi:putative protease